MLRRLRIIGALKVATLASLAFAAPASGSWSGVIRDVDGAPAAGAVIVLQPTHVTNPASVTTTTSAEGQFQFSQLSAGDYVFSVTFKKNIYRSPVHITLGNGAFTSDLNLELARAGTHAMHAARASNVVSSAAAQPLSVASAYPPLSS